MKKINGFDGLSSVLAFAAAIACAGCAGGAEGAEERVGTSDLAVRILNGSTENGLTLNGLTMNGAALGSFALSGVAITGITLTGTSFSGVRADNAAVVSGEQLEGTTLTGVLSDSSHLQLKIDAIDPTADPEILNYTVRYWDGASWLSLCGVKDGAPIQAIPLSGRWDLSSGTATGGDHIDDPNMVTFACHGAALAKCVVVGYKPWESETECSGGQCHDVPLRALHQACTRMIRADYCGDGRPHTVDGTLVNLWDIVGVQLREPVSDPWRTDAEWSEDGALCIDNLRWDIDGETTAYINARCPARWSTSFACFSSDSTFHAVNGYATPLAHRSLIRNEFNHGPVSP